MNTAQTLLKDCLYDSLTETQQQWFDQKRKALGDDFNERALHITLGLIPRKLGRADLTTTAEQQLSAEELRTGWKPSLWSVDTAARVLIILDVANTQAAGFDRLYTELCRTADLNEQITLYQATCLLEANPSLDQALGDGLRTSIQAVFEAIAHHNPYPMMAFDTHRWNHMVLKALFIDSTLHPIVGLDDRTNPELCTILCDYAHERWAAGRAVTPELWRCVGPHAHSDQHLNDLHNALSDPTPGSTEGALLALSQCPHPYALTNDIRQNYKNLLTDIDEGKLTWASVYETFI